MPKKLKLRKHVETEELERRYRDAHDPVERSHYQIIWLLSRGRLTREVAEVTGYTAPWIREIARRYNEEGEEGLGDRRHNNPGGGKRALLTGEQKAELGRALQTPPDDGGMWSSRKVAEWIEENDVVFEAYFDAEGALGDHRLRGGEYPRAADRYRTLFGPEGDR